MWKNRKGRVAAFLDDGSEFEGKYTCTGTVMLDAKLRGEITARDTLIIGANAEIEATVRAATLVVHGNVRGNLTATDRVELKNGANVTGDVEAPVIVMEAGSALDGRCRMTANERGETPLGVVVPLKK
jgi:cytoskeletal protein CcmA (bactofilin family)